MTYADRRLANALPIRDDGASVQPRRRGRPAGDKEAKGELLAAAMSVIAEDGYAGTSLRKVAERAGYTTGAVTYYFANKEALLTAVTELMFDQFDTLLQPGRAAHDIKGAFKIWLERMGSDAELWLVQFQLLAHARHEPACAAVYQRRYARYRQALAGIIERNQRNGKVRDDIAADLLADQLSAIGDGWMMMLPIEPERFEPRRIDALLDSLVAMLSPSPKPASSERPAPSS
jgi:AcrR family transcriptional regulator